jgi:hypothetical protein
MEKNCLSLEMYHFPSTYFSYIYHGVTPPPPSFRSKTHHINGVGRSFTGIRQVLGGQACPSGSFLTFLDPWGTCHRRAPAGDISLGQGKMELTFLTLFGTCIRGALVGIISWVSRRYFYLADKGQHQIVVFHSPAVLCVTLARTGFPAVLVE